MSFTECGAEWPDPGDIDHVCTLERGHAGPHHCVCGEREQ